MKHKNYVPINYQPFAALPPRPIRLLPEFHRNQFIRETHDHFRISPRCCRYAFKEFQKLKFVNIFSLHDSWADEFRVGAMLGGGLREATLRLIPAAATATWLEPRSACSSFLRLECRNTRNYHLLVSGLPCSTTGRIEDAFPNSSTAPSNKLWRARPRLY